MQVLKNYLYNTSYQLLAIILPLITGPYVSRVLGPKGVGINSYTYTIANWFVLLGSIGVGYYGNRQIAYVRRNKRELSQNFWEIFIMKSITILVSFLIFFAYILFIGRYKIYQFVQLSYVISAGLDISWFFMGIEDFKKTVIRNTFVKVISLIAILSFVKNESDLLLYIIILALSTLIGNITLWPFLHGIIQWVPISSLRPFRHLIGSLSLFLPLAAIQIYASLNKIMLGVLSNTDNSGFYDKSDAIVKMALTIATSLGTVLMPHTSKIYANGDLDGVKHLLYKSFNFITLISIPISLGLMGISLKFGLFFYGKGFQPVGSAMFIESIVIIFISWASVTGNQYLVPTNQIKYYTTSVFLGAFVNIILNIPFIKFWGLQGAILATVLSEVSVTSYQIWSIRSQVNYRLLFYDFPKCLLSGIVMFIMVFSINKIYDLNIINLLLEILVGALVYLICVYVLKPKIFKDIITFIYEQNSKRKREM